MSSTRRAKDNTVFHQSRYASSEDYERGLIANLVAKRAALLDDKADRDLIWFIQYLSHQEGGLAFVVKDLIAKYPERIQTRRMAELKLKPGNVCKRDQVKIIREDFSRQQDFPLNGEHWDSFIRAFDYPDERGNAVNDPHPESYKAAEIFDVCRTAAEDNLQNELSEICLNPQRKLNNALPWYFPSLIQTLREYHGDFVKAKSAGVIITALGGKVCDTLDYTAYCRGLTLVQGEARLGKSFAARQWCALHPGQARFVEVPPSNDDATFFRALARGLGLGSFLKYKVAEIRERVESVLLTGDILLVLDESHRLWPQMNIRYGFPSRINWVMAMANHKVPICCISTPQFIQWQKAAEEKGQWNSAQLTGRISHFENLPSELSREDLMAVAKSVLPEANTQTLQALAVYARSSARYLAAIDSIATRARYIASQDKRATATTADVRRAMQESVIPADTKLHCALEAGRKGRSRKITLEPNQHLSAEDFNRIEENMVAVNTRTGTLLATPIARDGLAASLLAPRQEIGALQNP